MDQSIPSDSAQETAPSADTVSLLPQVPISDIDINSPQYFFRLQEEFLDKLKVDFNSNFIRVHTELSALRAQVQEHHAILAKTPATVPDDPQPGPSHSNKRRKVDHADEFYIDDIH